MTLSQHLPTGLWQATSEWATASTAEITRALIIGAAVVVLLQAAKMFCQWLCREGRLAGHWPGIISKALGRTRWWFMAGVAVEIVTALSDAPSPVALPIHILFVTSAVAQVAIWVRTIILGIVQYRAEQADPNATLGSAVGIIRLLVTVALFLIASILILDNLGVNVTGLLAGLGIGGIAIGLAAQGIFSDLFAALSVLFDKPFRKGDLIRWETTTGTVEAIGLKSCRVRALSGEEIIISNANLLNKELRNFARLEVRRISQPIGLVYHLPVEQAEGLGALLEPAINACTGCTFIRCGLETFGASSLDFMLIYDVEAADPGDVLVRRNAVNLAILRVFAAQGIAFAYPTQTTFTAGPDGALVMPWAAPVKV